jgi:hypothetical protein
MAKKLTNEEFICKANIKHKNEYTYSKCNYIGTFKTVIITCSKHGDFEQRANNHLNGQGCPICGNLKTKEKQKMGKEKFIEKSNEVHKYKFNYSLAEYRNNKTSVKIICQEHGEFKQTPDNHINKKNGCPKCCGNSKLSSEELLIKMNKVHNSKYNYSLENYKNTKSLINITCPIHGEFKCRASHHLSGIGCSKCSHKHNYSSDEFISVANKIHGNKYNYSKTKYINSKNKIIITCKNHGDFKQTPSSHLNKRGCPACKESKGELDIRIFLEIHNIEFIPQKKFKDCINNETNRLLPFDFYLPKYNMCIEYQGKQHFVSVKKWGGKNNLEKIQKRDKIKKLYCEVKNIHLLEINYLEDINTILNQII